MPDAGLTVLGLISGTSVDGLDAALVQLRRDGDALVARVLGYHEAPIDEELRRRVHALFRPDESRIDEVCEVNVRLAEAFAEAGREAMRVAGLAAVDLVASHGQTVWHQVQPGHTRSTLQLGEPSVLAERLGATVVADFRPRDIAAGGQGAPLASWPDALLFGSDSVSRAVQNIGGIGNVTWVPAGRRLDEMLAWDTGPGNALIDRAVWRLTDGRQRCDQDGALAADGTPDAGLLGHLLAQPYFHLSPPKTTGRELFGAQLVDPIVDRWLERGLSHPDLVATLTAFTAESIADQYRRFLPRPPDEVVVGGGGSQNPILMDRLRALLAPTRVVLHESFGLPSLGREAVYFALMGHEALFGRPNTVPACTGADHPVVMGKIVPGPNYRALVRRVAATPDVAITRLRVEPQVEPLPRVAGRRHRISGSSSRSRTSTMNLSGAERGDQRQGPAAVRSQTECQESSPAPARDDADALE